MRQLSVCGEYQVMSQKKRLPEIVQGYSKDDIVWNMDDTGVIWKALPNHGFGQKDKECKEKQRTTASGKIKNKLY